MKKVTAVLALVLITILFVTSAYAKDPVKLKMATFLPKEDVNLTGWLAYVDEVNKKSNGEVVVAYVGGPEAMPAFKQFEAVRTGVVDMIIGCESYYGASVSGAAYTHLSQLTPMDERKAGYYNLRVDMLKKHNVMYLGRPSHGSWFHLFTNKEVKKPQELAGQKIRASATYEPFIKMLGAAPIMLPGAEVYTALERKVVDGYAWSVVGNVTMGWPEVCKFIVGPRIYAMNLETLINLNSWNKVPAPMQKLMSDLMIANEEKYEKIHAELGEKELRDMLGKGMKMIQFSPEDTKWYVDLAYKAGWEEMIKKSPELGPKLRTLLSPN